MSRSITIGSSARARRARETHNHLWVGLILALIVGVLLLAIAYSTTRFVEEAFAEGVESAPAAQSFPARELPRDWRWERKAMAFDGMVRENESPGRHRWLRDTPYRPGGEPAH